MRLKYYLRGMGIGIIGTTLLLMILFSFQGNDTISDEEIMIRAASLGMVSAGAITDTEKLSDAAEPDTSEALDEKSSEDTAYDTTEETTKEDAAGDDIDDANKSPANKSDEPSTETVEQVKLSIVAGEYSDEICKKLKRAGVIDNAKDFNAYLAKMGADSQILPGTYTLKKGADYDEILRIITEKPE